MEQINYADYVEILQSMSLEEIRAVLEVLQKSTDSYIYHGFGHGYIYDNK